MNISKTDLGRHLPNELVRRIEIVNESIIIKCEKCDANICCSDERDKGNQPKMYEVKIQKNIKTNGIDFLRKPMEILFDKLPTSINIVCDKRNGEGFVDEKEPLMWEEDENPDYKLLRKLKKSFNELQDKENHSAEEIQRLDWLKTAILEMEQKIENRFEHSPRGEILRCQWLEKAEKYCLTRNMKDIEQVVKACLKIIGGDR